MYLTGLDTPNTAMTSSHESVRGILSSQVHSLFFAPKPIIEQNDLLVKRYVAEIFQRGNFLGLAHTESLHSHGSEYVYGRDSCDSVSKL